MLHGECCGSQGQEFQGTHSRRCDEGDYAHPSLSGRDQDLENAAIRLCVGEVRNIKAIESKISGEHGKLVASLLMELVAYRCGTKCEAYTVAWETIEEGVLGQISAVIKAPQQNRRHSEDLAKFPVLSAFFEKVGMAKVSKSEVEKAAGISEVTKGNNEEWAKAGEKHESNEQNSDPSAVEEAAKGTWQNSSSSANGDAPKDN